MRLLFVMCEACAVRVIDIQCPIADHTAPDDLVADVEIVIESSESLPGEFASHSETTNITT